MLHKKTHKPNRKTREHEIFKIILGPFSAAESLHAHIIFKDNEGRSVAKARIFSLFIHVAKICCWLVVNMEDYEFKFHQR